MWEIAVHLAVAGGVYNGVILCCPNEKETSVKLRFYTYLLHMKLSPQTLRSSLSLTNHREPEPRLRGYKTFFQAQLSRA